jgi:hypothetical protein
MSAPLLAASAGSGIRFKKVFHPKSDQKKLQIKIAKILRLNGLR